MFCLACGVDLKERKGSRRLLSKQVLPVLLDTVKDVVGKDVRLETEKLTGSFVCTPCFREMEKLKKLEEQLKNARERLTANVRKAMPYLPVVLETAESTSQADDQGECSGRKRQLSPQRLVSSSPKRRRQLMSKAAVAPSDSSSPAVSVTVHYASKPRSFVMTPKRRGICKPLARGNRVALARRCLKDLPIRKHITKGVGLLLQREVASMCSDKADSILRSKTTKAMEEFCWNDVIGEMKLRAPTLLSLLQSCTRTKKARKNVNCVIGLIAALLCKHRRPSASLVQRLISVILYSGHSSKRVYQRLQKLQLCMSHWRTIDILDKLGEGFDNKVLKWKKKAEDCMKSESSQQVDTSRRVTIVRSPTDDQSIDSEQSQSPSWNGSAEIATDAPVECLSSLSDQDIESTHLTSEESKSVEGSSSADSHTVTSPDISLLTGSHSDTDELSSPEKLKQPDSRSNTAQSTYTEARLGYKIVIDNIDKNVKPRNMRIDAQTKSLHYVQMYCVKDRIDFGKLSDVHPTGEKSLYGLLPTTEDYEKLKESFAVHVARVMVEHIPFFTEDFSGLVQRHIPHQYSCEMSLKSEVVPLGVIPKDETKYEDMMEILEHIHQYVPANEVQRELVDPETEEVMTIEDHSFVTTLVGGDQLTTARARGALLIREDCDLGKDRLDGLLPVTEDWHAKLCLMKVIWKKLYKTRSGMERGTLYQLRNLINRRNVVTSCKDDMNACEEFFELVVNGYIITAILDFLGMSSIIDLPLPTLVPSDAWMLSDADRRSIVMDTASEVVQQHVDLSIQFADGKKHKEPDTVYAYASELLSLGLLYFEFKDAVKEGDGDRLFRVWKYLLLLFKASNKKNYAVEAFTLLAQYHMLLPPRLAEQLKWSRFVNVHGLPGHNISCDLHMEHLNRLTKTAIVTLGVNKSEKAIIRVGKSIGTLEGTLKTFDKEHVVPAQSGAHSERSNEKDLKKILKLLQQVRPFQSIEGRKYKSFTNLRPNMIRSLDEQAVKDWMIKRFAKMI